ncbi:hypothetical protein TL16_g00027 [Triparma laevis f. inornata]|uniref:Uncharacterized protein n=1 Tax=Triparma laevis f. inornata TaxID=1714386 RepID=A0A9W6ZBV0_9STRA|nr:hypothetical protein TL16_g00027 [Triparma laevis f. inornata]
MNSAMTDVRSSTTSNSSSFVSRSKSKFERKSFALGSSSLGSSRLAKIGFGVNKAVELFNKIAFLIYDRFKQEAVIDLRVKEDFIKNIPKAPPLTEAERMVITETMNLVSDMSVHAKRISGTANDSVEKFIYRQTTENGKDGIGWGISVAKIDVAATTLFTEIWLIDTYEARAIKKDARICEVWSNLDGTRGLQYAVSVRLPSGFMDRLFESWITWERRVDEEGLETFIVAIIPLEEYSGTKHPVFGAENMKEATSKGVHIIRELTKNTCEWTRAQQADLNIIGMPSSFADFLVKQQLAWANEEHEKFRRSGRDIDRERRYALADVMRGAIGETLMGDQLPVYRRCEELLGDGGEEGWKALESPCPDVQMKIRYLKPNKEERSIATGMGIGVVDCSAEEMAAWMMDYCSNERMRISKEEGNPARLELRNKARLNEATFASVKKMPIFLNNRELVYRMIWKSEEGKVLVAIESVDDDVDYGTTLRKVRGLTRCLCQIENLPDIYEVKQCRVTLVQQVDAGRSIPAWVVAKKVPVALNSVQWAIDEFRQDEKVDAAKLKERATSIREEMRDAVYSEEEEAMLRRVSGKYEGKRGGVRFSRRSTFIQNLFRNPLDKTKRPKNLDWKQLKSPDVFVKIEFILNETGKNLKTGEGVGRATTVIDSSIEGIMALELAKLTRKRRKERVEFGGLECNVTIAFPIGNKYVRASATSFWKFEKLPDIEGIPQTSVTYYQQVDLKGYIPHFVMNGKIVETMSYLSEIRQKFDKSMEIDECKRSVFAKEIKNLEISSSALCKSALEQFEALFEDRVGSERPSKMFGLADSMVLASIIGGKVWSRTSLVVRAMLEDIAAFFWDFGSRANMEISGDVERSFEDMEEGGDFKKFVSRRYRLKSKHGTHHRDRSFSSEMSITRTDSDTIIFNYTPIKQWESRDKRRSTVNFRGSAVRINFPVVNGEQSVGIRLTRMVGGRTSLDYACDLEVGSNVSRRASRAFAEQLLGEIADISVYFQRLVPLREYKKEDGKALGSDLLWGVELSSRKRVARLMKAFEKSRALRELKLEYPFIQAMMIPAVRGNLNINKVIGTKLECISEAEAIQIGKNFIPSLKSKKVIGAGVDVWRLQNSAVKELMVRHEWFKPMSVVLGKGIVKAAAWGLMWRVLGSCPEPE